MIKQIMGVSQYVSHMSKYHAESSHGRVLREPANETDRIQSENYQIKRINNETNFIKETGKSPPSWKLNYLPSLNIIS